jgi:hypothetical protein
MAFTPINSAAISVGSSLKKELFDLVKTDLDNHEERINSLESTAAKVDIFKFLLLNGSSFSTATGLSYYRAEDTFTITKAAIQIFEKNAGAGSIEIDIKVSTTDLNGTSFTSIFTTKPKLIYASIADYAESSNQVFDAARINIVPGNYLRLDITIVPTSGVLPKILITSYGE